MANQEQYLKEVSRLRAEIFNTLNDLGVKGSMPEEVFNPLNTVIEENGGIGLEFAFGIPLFLRTPWGALCTIICEKLETNEKDIFKEFELKYGLKPLEHKVVFGPIYSITISNGQTYPECQISKKVSHSIQILNRFFD